MLASAADLIEIRRVREESAKSKRTNNVNDMEHSFVSRLELHSERSFCSATPLQSPFHLNGDAIGIAATARRRSTLGPENAAQAVCISLGAGRNRFRLQVARVNL